MTVELEERQQSPGAVPRLKKKLTDPWVIAIVAPLLIGWAMAMTPADWPAVVRNTVAGALLLGIWGIWNAAKATFVYSAALRAAPRPRHSWSRIPRPQSRRRRPPYTGHRSAYALGIATIATMAIVDLMAPSQDQAPEQEPRPVKEMTTPGDFWTPFYAGY
ncbi:hypothetical protein FHU33_4012 [Blastococcus colisei]|uniref:Uncharacterized protein n=1 Tax=Blastococcus colisei TaxID=1564162 RepID=A0A543NZU9_9ACTN|nr:hypothetical protein [Blastococcus colisei]TQN37365.1 hypothetical protein FHU33_4012 [Blastococcus colisei]